VDFGIVRRNIPLRILSAAAAFASKYTGSTMVVNRGD
jgi:hypothetical protein